MKISRRTLRRIIREEARKTFINERSRSLLAQYPPGFDMMDPEDVRWWEQMTAHIESALKNADRKEWAAFVKNDIDTYMVDALLVAIVNDYNETGHPRAVPSGGNLIEVYMDYFGFSNELARKLAKVTHRQIDRGNARREINNAIQNAF